MSKAPFLLSNLLALTVCLATSSVDASAQSEREAELNAAYVGKTLHLKRFYIGNTQIFDKDGKLIGQGTATGPWTLYGRIAVERISVVGQSVHVEGRRLHVVFQDNGKTLIERRAAQTATLVLSPADASRPSFDAALQAITIEPTPAALADVAPDCWSTYLRQGVQAAPRLSAEEKPETPPRVIRTGPKPGYSDEARAAKVGGTVQLSLTVTESGEPREIRLIRPLGMGLDDAACDALRQYLFQPARRSGSPVKLNIIIETTFHLD